MRLPVWTKLTLLLIVLAGLAYGESALAESLESVVHKAVETHPAIGRVNASRRATDAEVDVARSGYYPSVDLSAGIGRENTDTKVIDDRWESRREANLRLTQLLYDGGAVGGKVSAASARRDEAGSDVLSERENVGLRAVNSYLDVMKLRQLVSQAENNVATHKEMLRLIKRRASSGAVAGNYQVLAEGRLALAQAELASFRGDLAEAEASYHEVVGELPSAKMTSPSITGIQLPETEAGLLASALEKNPGMASAKYGVSANTAEVGVAKAGFFPKINFELGATRNKGIDGVAGKNNDLAAMLRLNYNLFNGKASTSRVRQAKERESAAKMKLSEHRRTVTLAARKAYRKLTSARDRLPLLRANLKATAKAMEIARLQFKLGKRSVVDLLNRSIETHQSQLAYISEQYQEKQAVYEICAVQGLLLEMLRAH